MYAYIWILHQSKHLEANVCYTSLSLAFDPHKPLSMDCIGELRSYTYARVLDRHVTIISGTLSLFMTSCFFPNNILCGRCVSLPMHGKPVHGNGSSNWLNSEQLNSSSWSDQWSVIALDFESWLMMWVTRPVETGTCELAFVIYRRWCRYLLSFICEGTSIQVLAWSYKSFTQSANLKTIPWTEISPAPLDRQAFASQVRSTRIILRPQLGTRSFTFTHLCCWGNVSHIRQAPGIPGVGTALLYQHIFDAALDLVV